MSFLDKTGLSRLWENILALADTKVPTSRTVNGKTLTSDITLSASDVGAALESHTHDDIYDLANEASAAAEEAYIYADNASVEAVQAYNLASEAYDATNYIVSLTAIGSNFTGTVSNGAFVQSGLPCRAFYRRIGKRCGLLSLNFTCPVSSVSDMYEFVNLSNICNALGLSYDYSQFNNSQNGHWLCPAKTNLYGYGSVCQPYWDDNSGAAYIGLARVYETSGTVGKWGISSFSGANVQILDVLIIETNEDS